jgi:Flp pilus assembly pilin Flp
MPMHTACPGWWQEEDAQDITEYSLLLAFVALVSAALFLYNSSAVSSIWTSASSYLAKGAS